MMMHHDDASDIEISDIGISDMGISDSSRRDPGGTKEAPRRHPGGTQEAPKRHPEPPRAPRKLQEAREPRIVQNHCKTGHK